MGALALRASQAARAAHQGQTDQAGAPYIGHPSRVASQVHRFLPQSLELDSAQAVAWLHDVVEDTAMTLDEVAAEFPAEVVSAVDALTRRPGEDPDLYYRRVQTNPLALAVKAADLVDNCDPLRLALLNAPTRARLEAKYTHAREALGLTDPDRG